MSNAYIVTAAQCRAARALIEWSIEQLVEASSIDAKRIIDFEGRYRMPDDDAKRRLRSVLEGAGVVFISENGGGAGVRLKFNRREVIAINRWEGEGGRSGEDDIM